jgi:hypothetical protein
MISSDNIYYNKYLKYKYKYELLNNKNIQDGGVWPFNMIWDETNSSKEAKKPTEVKKSKQSTNNLEDIFKKLLRDAYFNLFYIDIPKILNNKNISNEVENNENEPSKPSISNEDTYDTNDQYGGIDPPSIKKDIDDNDQKNIKKNIMWIPARDIYNQIFKDYPELRYVDRMKNLKSYIIMVIIKQIFYLESKDFDSKESNKSTKSKKPIESNDQINYEKLAKKFKMIGVYIYFKLYQLLHYNGRIQFVYINNNYAPVNYESKIEGTDKHIKEIIDIFTKKLKDKTNIQDIEDIYTPSLKMPNRNSKGVNYNFQILKLLEVMKTNNEFTDIIDMNNTYFFDAFIELTIKDLLYSKDK